MRTIVWAVSLTAVAAACGGRGQSNERQPEPDDGGNANTPQAGSSQSGSAGDTASGSGMGTGGSSAGAIGVGGSNALPECASNTHSDGSTSVRDPNSQPPKQGLTEKVTVTAVKLFPTPDSPTTASYTVQTTSGDWQLSVSHPELTETLIQVGDMLELRLASWPGYIPLTSWQNHAFGLFDDSDKLVLFGADAREASLPVPDLSLLGLEIEDLGATCATRGGSCESVHHHLRIGDGEASVELTPGKLETLGQLRVLLASAAVPSGFGGCDASSMTVLVGIVAP